MFFSFFSTNVRGYDERHIRLTSWEGTTVVIIGIFVVSLFFVGTRDLAVNQRCIGSVDTNTSSRGTGDSCVLLSRVVRDQDVFSRVQIPWAARLYQPEYFRPYPGTLVPQSIYSGRYRYPGIPDNILGQLQVPGYPRVYTLVSIGTRVPQSI